MELTAELRSLPNGLSRGMFVVAAEAEESLKRQPWRPAPELIVEHRARDDGCWVQLATRPCDGPGQLVVILDGIMRFVRYGVPGWTVFRSVNTSERTDPSKDPTDQ